MVQTPAKWVSEGVKIEHTFAADAIAGDVVVVGNRCFIAASAVDYSEQPDGTVYTQGLFDIPQIGSIKSYGDEVYWDADGDPYGGTAGSGAATAVGGDGVPVGYVALVQPNGTNATSATDTYVRVVLNQDPSPSRLPVTTTAVGGTAINNANSVAEGFNVVTGADDTAAVQLPSAIAGAQCIIKSTTAGKNLVIFPEVSDKINALSANTSYNMADDVGSALFVAADATTWYSVPLAP